MATLVLIPVTLGDTSPYQVCPAVNFVYITQLRHFVVENLRSARRFLKQVDEHFPIDECTFFTLNKHTSETELSGFLGPMADGHSIGVISEAGCPAIADPGADVVALAQRKGYRVMPLVGPSSILLALMASGCNGQNFAFNGYLPIDAADRIKTLKHLEQKALQENQTQLFIETPYRNGKLLEDILKTCRPSTRLCIAADLTLPTEFIRTRPVAEWKKQLPDLSKRPCMFVVGK